jgi:alpha-D-ribose 1-methylphosphonate 5-phosphate C-P lyase
MASDSVAVYGNHDDCGGGVVVTVAVDGESDVLKCLNCGATDKVSGDDPSRVFDYDSWATANPADVPPGHAPKPK